MLDWAHWSNMKLMTNGYTLFIHLGVEKFEIYLELL